MNKGPRIRATAITVAIASWLASAGMAQAAQLTDAAADVTSQVRTLKQGAMAKMSMGLAELYRQYQSAAPGSQVSLRSVSPAMHMMDMGATGMGVLIETASETPEQLEAELLALGMQHVERYGRVVSGWLPVSAMAKAAELSDLRYARPAMFVAHVGKAESQGDRAIDADVVRNRYNAEGSGVTVGVLSDSYNCLGTANADVASGDLPADLKVNEDLVGEECSGIGGTDEGRAMLQIVADVAPEAKLAFNTALHGQAGFANGILRLARETGAKVIVDDILFLAEPMFQDGIVAQAVDRVVSESGVSYFSAAGNNGRSSYEAPFRNSGVEGELGPMSHRHAFNDKGDTRMRVSIPAGETVSIVMQWDQPYFSLGGPGASTDMDIFLYAADGKTIVASSAAPNVGGDPVEILTYTNSSDHSTEYEIGIDLFQDPALPKGPEPGLIKFVYQGNMRIEEFDTRSSTSYGHANAEKSEGVGAAAYFNTPKFGVSPARLQPFSSAGGTPILFDSQGNRLPAPLRRLKPEIVAADAGDTSFFGSPDLDDSGFLNFFGTSAAAPHAAAVAALMRAHAPNATAADIDAALESTAQDMRAPGFDFDSGYGLIDAAAAFDALDSTRGRVAAIPSSVGFSQVIQGGSQQREITLTNRGTQPLVIGALGSLDSLTAPFAVASDNCSGKTLAPRTNCTFNVSFSPTAAGDFEDSVDVASDDPVQPHASVRIIGISADTAGPRAAVEPATGVRFDQTQIGESRTQTVSIRNLGGSPLALTSIKTTGTDAAEFEPLGSCREMASGEGCQFGVSFSPKAKGDRSSQLVLNFSSAGHPSQTQIDLKGTGTDQASAVLDVQDNFDLGDVLVGDARTRTLTVFNRGADRLSLSDVSISGRDAADYRFGTTCNFEVPTGGGCFLSLTLSPSANGPRDAELVIASNDPAKPERRVRLEGSGGTDGDGVPDATEDKAPKGDGNRDGIPDRQQDNVASVRGRNGLPMTLVSPSGTRLTNVSVENAPDRLPSDLRFTRGFLRYTVEGVGPEPIAVQVILGRGEAATIGGFYARGPEPDNAVDHNYDLTQALRHIDSARANIRGDRITLMLQDGGIGDSDGLRNGRITSFGGPGLEGRFGN